MPPVIAAIVEFTIEAFFSAGLSWAAATALTSMLLSLGASVALGAISKMFTKGPSSSSLTSQMASRSVTSRQLFED